MPDHTFHSTHSAPHKAPSGYIVNGPMIGIQRLLVPTLQPKEQIPDPKELFLRHESLDHHGRVQEDRQQNQIAKKEEIEAKGRQFNERWENLNWAGKAIPATLEHSNDGAVRFQSGAITVERDISPSLPTVFSYDAVKGRSTLYSPARSVLPSPTPGYNVSVNVQDSMAPSEWKEYGQFVNGYVLYSHDFTTEVIEDVQSRGERLGLYNSEPAIVGKHRRPSIA